MPICIDCGKQTTRSYIRCKSCGTRYSHQQACGYDPITQTKICYMCHVRKPLSAYGTAKHCVGGVRGTCKVCCKIKYGHKCIDCGARIVAKATRCKKCFTEYFGKCVKAAWADGQYDNRPSHLHTEATKKHLSKAIKSAWETGVFDRSKYTSKRFRQKRRKIMLAEWASGTRTAIPPKNPSKLELRFAKALSALHVRYKQQYKIGTDRRPFDFYLSRYKVLVEIDGDYWHSIPGAVERDAAKTVFALQNGYTLYRLPEHVLNNEGEPAIAQALIEHIQNPSLPIQYDIKPIEL